MVDGGSEVHEGGGARADQLEVGVSEVMNLTPPARKRKEMAFSTMVDGMPWD